MAEKERNEGVGQQPPISQDTDDELDSQSREKSKHEGAEQAFQQADRQQQDRQPEGQQSRQPQDQKSGGFVAGQDQDSGEYLQKSGNPESGFAEQGRGAPDEGDIERGGERSENRESEGSSDND